MVALADWKSSSKPEPTTRSFRHSRPRSPESAYPRFADVMSGQRFYKPEISRWISRDPVVEKGFGVGRERRHKNGPSVNVYLFADNAPIVTADILGLVAWDTPGIESDKVPFWDDADYEGIYKRGTTAEGSAVARWLADPEVPIEFRYNCHGYTFNAPHQDGGYAVVPHVSVPPILKDEWERICCGNAQMNDIVVFWGSQGATHSGIIVNVSILGGRFDLHASTLTSKRGHSPQPLPPAPTSFFEEIYTYRRLASFYTCHTQRDLSMEHTCCPQPGQGEIPITEPGRFGL
jgi:RHS repeat-associated protein